MEKIKALEKILIYDRIIRFNIDLLTGIKAEIKADAEETKILSESFLEEEGIEYIKSFLRDVENEFIKSLDELLDHIYDKYELFNVDITFLSSIPEEVGRDIDRLKLIEDLNNNLARLSGMLGKACHVDSKDKGIEVILTPFRVYCELINHAIEFNKRFENI